MIRKKILDKSARICIIGLGYVGLPLTLLCVKKGYSAIGIDMDKQKIDYLKSGKSYIVDVSDKEVILALKNGSLKVTFDYKEITLCDIILICVPTPITADCEPDYSYILSAVKSIAENLCREQLIIIESTVAPGTTESLVMQSLLDIGLKPDRDFYLAYSPERIDPGNKLYNIENTPKLAAGVTLRSQLLTKIFYEQLGIRTISIELPIVAELAKLLENVYRDVNIALINEMAQVCALSNISIWEVISAASTKPYGFQAFYPGVGVGGHCVPVDSVYYSSWAREKGFVPGLVERARKLNSSMPDYIALRLKEILSSRGKSIKESKIFILGVTYKKDVNDIRNSPVIKLMEKLTSEDAIISYHDPFFKKVNINKKEYLRTEIERSVLTDQDCVVLASAHSCYNSIPLQDICPLIFDLTDTIPMGKRNEVIKF